MTQPEGTREYRKTATVFARQVGEQEEMVKIYSLEGPAIANPGDYILTANTDKGESWVCAKDVFEATYEPVD